MRPAGVLAPLLLAFLRFLQGVGFGGEWGGAALLAVENAPHGRRAWFGMFPQLGPPIGFFIATALFLALLIGFGEAAFVDWAWRVPFLMSAILVAIGLYVRVALEETPAFKAAIALDKRVAVPLGVVLRDHLAAADPGLARDRRVLRAVLHFDRLYAGLWREIARHCAREPARDHVRGDRVHGARDADLGGARRPGRPAPGAARFRGRRRRGRARHAGAAGARVGRRPRLPLARARRDGAQLRAARGAAAGIVPDRGALYRRGQRLQSRRHSRRIVRAVARANSRGERRHRVGRLLHRRRRRDQLLRHPQHARDASRRRRTPIARRSGRPFGRPMGGERGEEGAGYSPSTPIA